MVLWYAVGVNAVSYLIIIVVEEQVVHRRFKRWSWSWNIGEVNAVCSGKSGFRSSNLVTSYHCT